MDPVQRSDLRDRVTALKRLLDEKASCESELLAAQSNIAGSCECYQSPAMLRLTTFRDEAERKLQDVERRLGDAKDALRTAVDRGGHLGEDVLAEATALLCG